jgi:F-type H+-transporting ATPase subunit a
MGDHDTLYTVLMSDFWARLEGQPTAESLGVKEQLAREWTWMMFQDTHFSLIHVASAVIAFFFIIFVTLRYRASLKDDTQGVVPPRKYGLAAMMHGFLNACFNMSADIMGEKNAKRFLPFIGTLALFIFVNNIQGLIPGLLPGTDTLKTNLALAVIVFVVYNVVGIKEQGLHYLAHFMGPSFPIMGIKFPWLFPLMLPIEIASHIARPVSLSLRLMGNILADHKVVGAILLLIPLLVPVPFMLLGVLVSIVQTVVFTLLTVIYIGMACEHAEEH